MLVVGYLGSVVELLSNDTLHEYWTVPGVLFSDLFSNGRFIALDLVKLGSF